MCGWAAPTAKPMNFIDASGKSLNMLPRNCIAAFEQLKQLLNVEGANLADILLSSYLSLRGSFTEAEERVLSAV